MYLTRIVQRGSWTATLALLTALGCGSPAPTGSKSTDGKKPENAGKTEASTTSTTSKPAAATAAADQFAAAFLSSVQAGKATPEELAPAFRSQIAEPVLEADRATGFSRSAAEKWLQQYSNQSFQLDAKPVFTTANAAGFRGNTGERTFSLRLVKAPTGWLVDWFAPVGPAGVKLPVNSAEGFAAAAFLDAVVSKSERLVEGMLSPAAKTREAPPFASDKARGYNRGVLLRRVEEFRSGAVAYNLAAITGDTATGTLGDKPFTLKLIPGTEPGQWLVDAFEKQ